MAANETPPRLPSSGTGVRLRTVLLALAVITAAILLWPRKPATWPIRNTPPRAGSIVCFGDSLTRGHGAEPEESYPAVLARLLGREVQNAGRDGEISESALERLDENVPNSKSSPVERLLAATPVPGASRAGAGSRGRARRAR